MDEIPAPNVVLVLRTTTYATIAAMAQTSLFSRFLRYFQAFFPPKSIDAFGVYMPTFLTQLGRYHAITVPRILPRQLVQPGYQPLLVRRNFLGPIPLGTPSHSQGFACPTLRNGRLFIRLLDRLAPPRRAQQFPSKASFKMSLSSVRSATSFFKRLFSCSSFFKRFASSAFIPPYWCRQR